MNNSEIEESKLRAALIGELIKARQNQGISQKKLAALSGVKQPIIARLEMLLPSFHWTQIHLNLSYSHISCILI